MLHPRTEGKRKRAMMGQHCQRGEGRLFSELRTGGSMRPGEEKLNKLFSKFSQVQVSNTEV